MDEILEQQPPDHILEVIKPLYQQIWDTVGECWKLWHSCHSPAKQSLKHYRPLNRAIGSDMSDMLKAFFKERVEEGLLPNIDFYESASLWFIVLNKKASVRFNLMNKEGMTTHTPTGQYEMYRDGQMPIEGFEKLEPLFGGYILDEAKSDVINLYILKRDYEDRPIWVIDNRYGVFTQEPIPYQTPARMVEPKEQQRRKRASAKTKLTQTNLLGQEKTGTDNA